MLCGESTPGQEHLRLQRENFFLGSDCGTASSWSAGGRGLGTEEGQDGFEKVLASQTTERGQKYVKHV